MLLSKCRLRPLRKRSSTPNRARRWVCQRWRDAVFQEYRKEEERTCRSGDQKSVVLQIMPPRIDLLPA